MIACWNSAPQVARWGLLVAGLAGTRSSRNQTVCRRANQDLWGSQTHNVRDGLQTIRSASVHLDLKAQGNADSEHALLARSLEPTAAESR